MGTLTKGGRKKDSIQIVTDTIEPNGSGGVRKKSDVNVKGGSSQTFVLGMKIRTDRQIIELSFDGNDIRPRFDQGVADKCAAAFPPAAGETWWGYKLLAADLPNPSKFKTQDAGPYELRRG